MIRTRFRPSANGPLHFGGAYVARHNWYMAHAKGGQFVLIVDDVVPVFKYGSSPELTAKMREFGDAFRRDLEWLGYPPDVTVFASDMAEAHYEAAARLQVVTPWVGSVACLQRYVHSMSEGTCTTYHPWLTVGRVTDDHVMGVTDFVRGGDLIGEVQLYDHLARSLYGEGYRVNQDYLETIIEPDGTGVCSKSDGTPGIADYRAAGVTAEQIGAALADMLECPTSYGAAHSRYRQVDAQYLQVPLDV
jgi:glutamyl/glutaminyl-tRNA synthetase